MLTIGSFTTPCRVLLAPIAGYTDLAFRRVVRAAGHTGLAYTELLHSRGLMEQKRDSMRIAATDAGDQPFGVQLYGNDGEWFCEAAKWAQDHGAQVLDINMGCPVDKVTKTNGGSMLLCDPERTTRMAQAIVNSISIPVTCKLRLGWNLHSLTAPQLARQLEGVGIQLITIHGRTTQQRFKGSASLDGIAAVVAAVDHIPVIGNGDILTPTDAQRMVAYTKCAGVMVARGAIKKPWLLREIQSYLTTGVVPPEPTVLEKVRLIRLHFDLMCEYRSEREAMVVMRGRISSYGTTMGHIKPTKERVRLMRSARDFQSALDALEAIAVAHPDWTSVPMFAYGDRQIWSEAVLEV